jgi:hypothetical protein
MLHSPHGVLDTLKTKHQRWIAGQVNAEIQREAQRRLTNPSEDGSGGFLARLLAALLVIAAICAILYAAVKFLKWAWYN